MREVNVTEFRNHMQKYLTHVRRGSEILITSHGQVIARIAPPGDVKGNALKKLRELRKHCKVGDVVSPIDEEWDAAK